MELLGQKTCESRRIFAIKCYENGIDQESIKEKLFEFFNILRNRNHLGSIDENISKYKNSMSNKTKSRGQQRNKSILSLIDYCGVN
jgi:hypothetical protein